MPSPEIHFNNSTGSDTLTSGSPHTLTPVNGTAAAHTNGSASTTITLTNSPNLSSVPIDGSAVLKLFIGAGRRWSKITAVDNGAKTVTVEDSFTIALASAVNYAIGGKLSSIDGNTQIQTDGKALWVFIFEYTGTHYDMAGGMQMKGGDSTNGVAVWKGDSPLARPTIRSGAANSNAVAITSYLHVQDLIIIARNTSGTTIIADFGGSILNVTFRNVKIRSESTLVSSIMFYISGNGAAQHRFIGCEFDGNSKCLNGFSKQVGTIVSGTATFINCYFHHFTGNAVEILTTYGLFAAFNKFANNAKHIRFATSFHGMHVIMNNTFDTSSDDAIETGLISHVIGMVCINNIFTGVGGTGKALDIVSGGFDNSAYFDHNLFYNNATDRSGVVAGANDVSGNPLFITDTSMLQSTSPAKAVGFPKSTAALDALSFNFIDIGCFQRRELAGNPKTVIFQTQRKSCRSV